MILSLIFCIFFHAFTAFTYRYFLHRWPQLCILAVPTENDSSNDECSKPIGCVVCKIDIGEDDSNEDQLTSKTLNDAIVQKKVLTGYIGMLAVEKPYRRSGIGSALVHHAIHRMKEMRCTSIRLETEVSNKSAMRLYEDRFGFMREELLVKYYLNWGDAYRLRLWLD
jgi:peptide alpha-N-acetyltransferase